MINNNKLFIYLAASLSMIIPVPGRVVFCVYILVLFNLIVFLSTLFNHGITLLGFEKYKIGFVAIESIAITIFFKQLIVFICPLIALNLSFILYFPAITSTFLILFMPDDSNSLKNNIVSKMKISLLISVIVFVIQFLRDIIGFGTLTLPSWKKIITIQLPVFFENISLGTFVATIPGCFVLIGIILLVFIQLKKEENKE